MPGASTKLPSSCLEAGPAGVGTCTRGHQRWVCCCEPRLISALVLPRSSCLPSEPIVDPAVLSALEKKEISCNCFAGLAARCKFFCLSAPSPAPGQGLSPLASPARPRGNHGSVINCCPARGASLATSICHRLLGERCPGREFSFQPFAPEKNPELILLSRWHQRQLWHLCYKPPQPLRIPRLGMYFPS